MGISPSSEGNPLLNKMKKKAQTVFGFGPLISIILIIVFISGGFMILGQFTETSTSSNATGVTIVGDFNLICDTLKGIAPIIILFISIAVLFGGISSVFGAFKVRSSNDSDDILYDEKFVKDNAFALQEFRREQIKSVGYDDAKLGWFQKIFKKDKEEKK